MLMHYLKEKHSKIQQILKSVIGASAHELRQRNNLYGKMVRRSLYDTRRPEHSHFLILRSTNNASGDPLHGPITWNPVHRGSTIYNYIYVYVIPVEVVAIVSAPPHLEPSHCPYQLSDVIIVISIGSFELVVVSDLIWLTVFDWI